MDPFAAFPLQNPPRIHPSTSSDILSSGERESLPPDFQALPERIEVGPTSTSELSRVGWDAAGYPAYDPSSVINSASATAFGRSLQLVDGGPNSGGTGHSPSESGPSIDFLSIPAGGEEGAEVSFYAQASGDGPLTYTWQFGDGGRVSGIDLVTASHAYQTNNPPETPYVVTLTVSNAAGQVSQSGNILIRNLPPEIFAGPSQTVYQGATVQFSGTATDPGGGSDIAAIEWDLDYNGTFRAGASGTLSPSHTYDELGTHLVALRVTDTTGATGLDVTSADVKPSVALLVNAGVAQETGPGTRVSFAGSYTGGGSISSISWDFNYNGTTFNPMISGTLTPTYTFTAPGNYRVALRVNGEHACGGVIDETRVRVHYAGPTAVAGSDQAVVIGNTVQFSGSYTDPDGTVAGSGIAWDFHWNGDFNPEVTGTLTPTYLYRATGDYRVALQVTDNHGEVDLSFLSVEVDHVAPYVYAGPNMTVSAGDVTSYTAYYQMAGDVAPAGIEWDFNYNGIDFNPDPSATGNLHPHIVYGTPGTSYTTALRVTDSGDASQIGTANVRVTSPRPVVNAGSDLTIRQGDVALFAGSVSSSDPVRIQWDFNYQGSFNPDSSAEGQLAPTHQYLAAGIFLVALRATDTVSGAHQMGYLEVTVNDVPPTATVTTSGPTPTGSPVTFSVQNMTSIDPNASFAVFVDWNQSGEFEAVPRASIAGRSMSFTHIWDSAGSHAVTIRLLDGKGGYTDYATTATIIPVTPRLLLVGPPESNPIGPNTTFHFEIDDLSIGDWIAGFRYFVSLDGGDFVETQSEFPGPSSPGIYDLRAYVVNRYGVASNIRQDSVQVFDSHTQFCNDSFQGSVRLRATGMDPMIIGPAECRDFPTIVEGLNVTLLSSGARYVLTTNSSFDSVDYDPGVLAVTLILRNYIGESNLPPMIGDGHIGAVRLPGGNSTVGSSHLTVYKRSGYLTSVQGPSGDGKHWADADAIAGPIQGSVTGLDHVGIIDNGLGGDVVVNCGIDMIGLYASQPSPSRITGHVISDLLRSTNDTSGNGTDAAIGYGGASGVVDLGKVNSLSTIGAADQLRAKVLSSRPSYGSVVMGNFASINQLYAGTTLGSTSIKGDYGAINRLMIGPGGANNLPALDYFPLGEYIIQDPAPGTENPPVPGPEIDRFWRYLADNSGAKAADIELLKQSHQVHHTKPTQFALVYATHGINVNSLENLRAVWKPLHTSEINNIIRSWTQLEMDKFNRGWNYYRGGDQAAFIKAVKNDPGFYMRLNQLTADIEAKYGKYFVPHTANARTIRQKLAQLADNKGTAILAARSDRLQGFADRFKLVKYLGAALALLSVIGVLEQNAAFAGNIVHPNPRAEAAFNGFYNYYQIVLQRALSTGRPATNAEIRLLSERLLDWLREANAPEGVRNEIWIGFTFYLNGQDS
jgi:hypothetical protein